jgi:uridine kinase
LARLLRPRGDPRRPARPARPGRQPPLPHPDLRLPRRPAPGRAGQAGADEDAILVFDGVFLLRPELDPGWDFRIFLDVPSSETLRRAVARDRELFGSADAVRERYRRRYLPGQRLYGAAVRPRERADVVVDNRDPAAPRLVAVRPPPDGGP